MYKRYGSDWQEMPVQLRELSKMDMARLAWSENESREDITAIEKAYAFKKAMTELNLTSVEVAESWGIHPSTASNLTRLLQLPQEIQQMVLQKKLLEKHARSLLPLTQVAQSEKEAVRLARAAAENSYSVKKIIEEVVALMDRLTVVIEAGMVGYETLENMRPLGCAAVCTACAHFRLWKHIKEWKHKARCCRPELYEQKHQIWLARGNTTDNNKTGVNTDSHNLSKEVLREFTDDTEGEYTDHNQIEISLFECPRCNHNKVTSANGFNRHCVGCGAE